MLSLLSNLVVTDVCSAGTLYTEKDAKNLRTDRPHWAVILKFEGETVYRAGGQEYISDATHPVLLPAGSSYEWRCTRAGRFMTLEFDCTERRTDIFSFSLKSNEKLIKLMRAVEHRRMGAGPLARTENLADTYAVLSLLGATVGESEGYLPSDLRGKIEPAVAYLNRHFTSAVTNEELAALTGLSTVYFRKLFTRAFGISPIAYLHELRIRRAKEMLASDYGSLTDLAFSLGYSNIYDFSRDFKKHTGVAPSRWQNGPF